MKRITFLSALALVVFLAQAQYVPTQADLDHFLETKTLVVKDQNPLNTFDAEIETVMEQEWEISRLSGWKAR